MSIDVVVLQKRVSESVVHDGQLFYSLSDVSHGMGDRGTGGRLLWLTGGLVDAEFGGNNNLFVSSCVYTYVGNNKPVMDTFKMAHVNPLEIGIRKFMCLDLWTDVCMHDEVCLANKLCSEESFRHVSNVRFLDVAGTLGVSYVDNASQPGWTKRHIVKQGGVGHTFGDVGAYIYMTCCRYNEDTPYIIHIVFGRAAVVTTGGAFE